MPRIILCYRTDYYDNIPIPTYSSALKYALEELGHEVLPIGEGHPNKHINDISPYILKQYDLFIDTDCGRNKQGNHHFQNVDGIKIRIPTAVWLIDSHGNPTLHKRLAKRYNHVFFAVWHQRDLFVEHPSAHWLPNASYAKWFDYQNHLDLFKKPQFTVGFFGSRHGLERANVLLEINKKHPSWVMDVREIRNQFKIRWPRTAEAMCNCKILFNRSQKHDAPNQRIMESMMCNKPLITDRAPESGLPKLFEEGNHYLGYAQAVHGGSEQSEVAHQIQWCLENPELAKGMAGRAYEEVKNKHQIKHRAQQILETVFK